MLHLKPQVLYILLAIFILMSQSDRCPSLLSVFPFSHHFLLPWPNYRQEFSDLETFRIIVAILWQLMFNKPHSSLWVFQDTWRVCPPAVWSRRCSTPPPPLQDQGVCNHTGKHNHNIRVKPSDTLILHYVSALWDWLKYSFQFFSVLLQ